MAEGYNWSCSLAPVVDVPCREVEDKEGDGGGGRDGDGGWKKGEKLERRMWLNSFGPFMARMKRPRRTDIGEKRRELL